MFYTYSINYRKTIIGGTILNKLFYILYDFHKSNSKMIIIIVASIALFTLGCLTSFNHESFDLTLQYLSFPLNLISTGLRTLSLSNTFLNIVAIILFSIFAFIPILFYMVRLKILKNSYQNRILGFIFYLSLSVLTGLTLYLLINPMIIKVPATLPQFNLFSHYQTDHDKSYQLLINTGLLYTIYLYIILYVTFRLYQYATRQKSNLFQLSNLLLTINKLAYIVLYIAAFYYIPFLLKNDFQTLDRTHDLDSIQLIILLPLKYFYQYTIIFILFVILRYFHDLLSNFKNEILFDTSNITLLKRISKMFIINLFIASIYQLLYNGLQLLLFSSINQVNIQFNPPITQIILALAFYLLSLIIQKSYQVYEEHRLTI